MLQKDWKRREGSIIYLGVVYKGREFERRKFLDCFDVFVSLSESISIFGYLVFLIGFTRDGSVVFGDSFGSFRDCMFGEFSWKQQSDGCLDLSR